MVISTSVGFYGLVYLLCNHYYLLSCKRQICNYLGYASSKLVQERLVSLVGLAIMKELLRISE